MKILRFVLLFFQRPSWFGGAIKASLYDVTAGLIVFVGMPSSTKNNRLSITSREVSRAWFAQNLASIKRKQLEYWSDWLQEPSEDIAERILMLTDGIYRREQNAS